MRPALSRFTQQRDSGYSHVGSQPSPDFEHTPELKTDDDYLQLLIRSYDEWYQARYAFEPGWWLTIAYYMGFQYHGWSEVERLIRETRAPSYRVRMVINKIMPLVKSQMGRLLRGDPCLQARPMDPSERAFSDARVANKLIKGLYKELDIRSYLQEFLIWLLTTGHAFIKVGWDPSLGTGVELPGYEPMTVGDVDIRVRGPFSILIPPEQMFLWRPSSIMDAGMFPIDYIKRVHGARAQGLQADQDSVRVANFEGRLATLVSPTSYMAVNAKSMYARGIYVMERWDDPQVLSDEERQRFPRGRVIIGTRHRLLMLENNPFNDEKHPFVDCRQELCPGRYWGASLIDQLIPIQKSYNRGKSQITEARNLTCNPVLDVEQGAGIAKHSAEPGVVCERRKGFSSPQWRNPPPLSPHLVEDVRSLVSEFEEVSQHHESSKGEVPAANITGVAVNLLQEADNTPLGPLAIRIASAIGQTGEKILSRAQQYYDEPRMIPLVGDNNEIEVVEFLGELHQSKLRVECLVDSILPESRAARLARVSDAIKMGALDPVRDKSAIVQLLEFGNVEQLWEEVDLDRQKQRRELKSLLRGVSVPVMPWDDHDTHLRVVNRYRKGVEYEALAPEIREILDAHADEHLLWIAQTEMATAAPPQQQALPNVEGAPMTAFSPLGGGTGAVQE